MARNKNEIKGDFEDYVIRSLSTIQRLQTMLFEGVLGNRISSGKVKEMTMHSQDLTDTFEKIGRISREMHEQQNSDVEEPQIGL